ncbi:hypothetical protein H5410_017364 [Solanum commersonii]|uniref:Uncharacterized protein n=1 Tax=Solanum commersonii TaxID=4109 RepID=A0A9J6A049_SOLCO|nr:hypothetical protein H5410_017364 [Solanum commersonii]
MHVELSLSTQRVHASGTDSLSLSLFAVSVAQCVRDELALSTKYLKDRVPADSTVLFCISVKSSAVSWTGDSESALRVSSTSLS